ncbi:MAG: hypothetical protein QXG81_07220 [Ignisphaera sp.]
MNTVLIPRPMNIIHRRGFRKTEITLEALDEYLKRWEGEGRADTK